MYRAIREAHQDIPYIMLSSPDIDSDSYDIIIDRRNIVMDTYRYAREHGDRNVYYIDGESIFRGSYEDSYVVIHPNDLGFSRMSDVILATLKRAKTQRFISD